MTDRYHLAEIAAAYEAAADGLYEYETSTDTVIAQERVEASIKTFESDSSRNYDAELHHKVIRDLTPAHARAALDRLIAEAVEKEREACAVLAESEGVDAETNVHAGGTEWVRHGRRIAAAIRGRA